MTDMREQDVEKKLLPLVAEILPPDPKRPALSRATKLLEDPAIDSLTMASLGFSISSAFGIATEDLVSLLPQFQTVDDAVRLTAAHLAGR